MTAFDELLVGLNLSLDQEHSSLQLDENPVLCEIRAGRPAPNTLTQILQQYSLLPATIVEFLTTGIDRLRMWTPVAEELNRNREEERGSRTSGKSHYSILKDGLRKEAGIEIEGVAPSASTARFLDKLRQGLWLHGPAYTAGCLYALEASAVPELEVVAELVNLYAELLGRPRLLPQEVLHDLARLLKLQSGEVGMNSLQDFFLMHLMDFEVGHRDGLETAVSQFVNQADNIDMFQIGFEEVLTAMDAWWRELADVCRPALLVGPNTAFQPHGPLGS